MTAQAWPHLASSGSAALAVAAFAVTWLLTERLRRWLAARALGKAIRVDGPDHDAKSGTPTMGGLAMIAVIVACAAWLAWRSHDAAPLLVAVGVCAYGALGLVDDLAGLAKRSGSRELGVGLTARRMLAAQAALGLALGLLWAASAGTAGDPVSSLLAAGIVAVTVTATANGANMTDGLDGLAAGVCALAFAAHAALIAMGTPGPSVVPIASIAGQGALAVLSVAAAASCAGFLVVNRHPARVFMGNVGSMALGAGLALVALASGTWWLLPVVAAVLVAEVVSVVLQVGYFKATGGMRILRMAPLHHHFEAGGMHEVQVVRRFWLAAAVAAAVGVGLAAGLSG